MLSFRILDVKKFMAAIFTGSFFDKLLLSRIEIITHCKIEVSGKRNQAWYEQDEWEILKENSQEEYILWEEWKNFAFEIIKGKRSPSAIHGVFLLQKQQMEELFRKNGEEELLQFKQKLDGLRLAGPMELLKKRGDFYLDVDVKVQSWAKHGVSASF